MVPKEPVTRNRVLRVSALHLLLRGLQPSSRGLGLQHPLRQSAWLAKGPRRRSGAGWQAVWLLRTRKGACTAGDSSAGCTQQPTLVEHQGRACMAHLVVGLETEERRGAAAQVSLPWLPAQGLPPLQCRRC